MKFFAFLSFLILLCSCCLSMRFKRTKRTYEQIKSEFKAAAVAGGGVYLDHSWKQSDFISRNVQALRWAIGNLTASPKAVKIIGVTVENLADQSRGVCAGMSIYFLNVMKILKLTEPESEANTRVDKELTSFGYPDIQNSVYMNALELQNIYSSHIVSMGKDAVNEMARKENLHFVEKTEIERTRTSGRVVPGRDVDLERQTSNIHRWIKSKHIASSFITVEFKTHATAYVRISSNFKLYFDPNFGIVKFTSISNIAKFFEGFFKIPEVRSGYMRDEDTIDLRAFS